MRNFETKERRKERQELVYRHADFIGNNYKAPFDEKIKTFIDGTVRKQLDYSCKTNSRDIWFHIQRTFKNLFV